LCDLKHVAARRGLQHNPGYRVIFCQLVSKWRPACENRFWLWTGPSL